MIVVICGVLTGILVNRQVQPIQIDKIQENLQESAQLWAEVFKLHAEDSPARLQKLAEANSGLRHRFTLIKPDGVVLADSRKDPLQMENHGDRPEILAALAHGSGHSQRYSTTIGKQLYYFALRVGPADQPMAIARTSVAEDYVDGVGQAIFRQIFMAVLIATAAAAVSAILLSTRLAGPIAAIASNVRKLGDGDYSLRIPEPTDRELADVARAFNTMAGELANQINKLATERGRLQTMIDHLQEGVIAIDQREQVMEVNAVACKQLEIEIELLRGTPLWEHCRIDDLNQLMTKAVAGEAIQEEVVHHRRQQALHFLVHAGPLKDADGNITGAVAVIHDITNLRQLEQIRRDFVANVSHELKTPLTSIRGVVDTILDDPEMPENTRIRFLNRAQAQTDRLSNLVTDLLVLSRLETTENAADQQILNLKALIEASMTNLAPTAEERGITLRAELGEPLYIRGDQESMRQVIDNLIDNAIKYSSEDGLVTVSMHEERTVSDSDEMTDSDVMARIDIKDTGIGIDPSQQARVFERFYRVDKARSRAIGGTGLGLSIVKHAVHSHQGTIVLSSRLGHGSTFTVKLPLNDRFPNESGENQVSSGL